MAASLLPYLRKIALLQDGAGLTDGQLLDCFLERREEAAFTAIVRRHEPMVLNVCRRILHNSHDAEDAFQATFLVLVRKATSIVPREMVAKWLHGVAYRTALKARSAGGKRRVKERRAAAMAPRQSPDDGAWPDLEPILDQELDRLPDIYRVAIVLCDLEGKTQKQAAKQLGLPEGTLSARLSRGRAMLAKRLKRRGVGVSGGVLSAVLSQNGVSASVPPELVVSTVEAATAFSASTAATGAVVSANVAALTEGALKAMLMSKLKMVTAVFLSLGILGSGASFITYRGLAAGQQSDDTPKNSAPAATESNKPKAFKREPPAKAKERTHPITVTGTATDQNGKPIKGATIYLVSTMGKDALLGTTTSDEQGNYRFASAALPVMVPRGASTPEGTFQVYGTAPGFGFTWHGMRHFVTRDRSFPLNEYAIYRNEPITANLQFGPATTIKGRVTDEAGLPIRQVKIQAQAGDYLDIDGRERSKNFREFFAMHWVPGINHSVQTDDDGGFEFTGFPREITFFVRVEHYNHARMLFVTATTDRAITSVTYSGERFPVLTGELKVVLPGVRKLEVHVVYADTGKPAAGTQVGIADEGKATTTRARGRTNAQGTVQIHLPLGEYNVELTPPPASDYVATNAGKLVVTNDRLPSVGGLAPEQKFKAKLNPGCILILKAVDADTGAAIPGVAFGEEAENNILRRTWRVDSEVTDATGKFRRAVQPGRRRYRVGFSQLPKEYEQSYIESEPLDLPAGKTVNYTFKLKKQP